MAMTNKTYALIKYSIFLKLYCPFLYIFLQNNRKQIQRVAYEIYKSDVLPQQADCLRESAAGNVPILPEILILLLNCQKIISLFCHALTPTLKQLFVL